MFNDELMLPHADTNQHVLWREQGPIKCENQKNTSLDVSEREKSVIYAKRNGKRREERVKRKMKKGISKIFNPHLLCNFQLIQVCIKIHNMLISLSNKRWIIYRQWNYYAKKYLLYTELPNAAIHGSKANYHMTVCTVTETLYKVLRKNLGSIHHHRWRWFTGSTIQHSFVALNHQAIFGFHGVAHAMCKRAAGRTAERGKNKG